MKTYKSPVYPALMIRLPGDGRRNIKASGGVFNVPDEDVKAFEKLIAARPHYKITPADGTAPASPTRITDVEKNPEEAKVVTPDSMSKAALVEALEARGIATSGNRSVLIQRLKDAIEAGEGDEGADDDDEDAGEGDQDADEEDLGSPDGDDEDDDAGDGDDDQE